MRFDNLHAHDALMNQLPTWFRPVLEYTALMEAYGVALDGLNEQGQAIYYNQFIQTADADTLAVWEKLFGITLRYGDTLDFRRQRLLQKFNQIVPYTVWHLRDRLTALYGDEYTLTVDPVACTISILVTSDRYGAIDLLYDLIWDVVPAHLKVTANQQTTSYATSEQYIAAFMTDAFVQTISTGGN